MTLYPDLFSAEARKILDAALKQIPEPISEQKNRRSLAWTPERKKAQSERAKKQWAGRGKND